MDQRDHLENCTIWIGYYDTVQNINQPTANCVTPISGWIGNCVVLYKSKLRRSSCGGNSHHICKTNITYIDNTTTSTSMATTPKETTSTPITCMFPSSTTDSEDLEKQINKEIHTISIDLAMWSASSKDINNLYLFEDDLETLLRPLYNLKAKTNLALKSVNVEIQLEALGGINASIAVVSSTKVDIRSQSDKNRIYDPFVVSATVSVSVVPWDEGGKFNFLDNPIELELYHLQNQTGETTRNCSFWKVLDNNTFDGVWSNEGCKVIAEGANSTTCSCNHLTNFAVLMKLNPDEHSLSVADTVALDILSVIGGSLSIVCLTLTLFIFALLRMFKTERVLVHGNLSLALLVSQLIFLTGIEAVENKTACTAIAVFLHYFLLASFAWMLTEGVLLFIKASFVFHQEIHPLKLMLIGWSMPLPVVAVTLAAALDGYGASNVCWLGVYTIWAFVGPVIFVVTVNLVIVIFVLRLFLRLKATKSKTEFDKIKSIMRALLIIQPLIGITWILGLGVSAPNETVFSYLFVILNSLQGVFIFVIYCVLTEEFKAAFTKRFCKRATARVEPKTENVSMNAISGDGRDTGRNSCTVVTDISTRPVIKKVQPWKY